MFLFIVTYTEDYGTTLHKVLVNADSFTLAYVAVDMKLSKDGAITDITEVK